MAERDRKGAVAGATRRRQRETAADRQRIGTVVAGSYRIDEMIGRGAIGAVFGGLHLRLERPVAVKFVDPTLVDDAEIRARFKREAKIAAQIRSSHAVEVYDYGVGEDGAPYLVMERLFGEDLHARMQGEGRIPVDRALRIAKQVCRALGAAHETGIVHRDLKPENVFLVDRDGEDEFVKVVDFGLSTFVQSDDTRLTRAGQSVGTPLYMAPEQAGAHAFDARVDVYSLGVLIFEMTTGRLPFEAATLQALLVALATQPPRSMRYYSPDLPVELDDLVLRFIARDPRVRPRSAAAALAEIIALEERLAQKTLPGQAVQSASGPRVRVRDLGVDGLPGPLQGQFAQEVTGHLDELRRTGKLTTGDTVPPESAPVSSGPDETRPMNRRELDDLMGPGADSSGAHRVAPRAAGRPVAPPPDRPSPRKVRPAPAEEEIEEDSGVFYGRIGKDGKPIVDIKNVESRGESSTLPPSITQRGKRPSAGPPPMMLWLALVAFVVVAVLVAVRALR